MTIHLTHDGDTLCGADSRIVEAREVFTMTRPVLWDVCGTCEQTASDQGIKAFYDVIDKMDLETIANAKAQLERCKVGTHAQYPALLGGCEAILEQLIRVAERRMEVR